MATAKCTSKDGLSDLQLLLIELEKAHPDPKIIKDLTGKYGIPYKSVVSEQLNELLMYLNSLAVPPEQSPDQ